MTDIEPGNDVPYTHKEIFLANDLYVGKGLATLAELDNSDLISKDTFKEIVSDFTTLKLIRSNEQLYNELITSEVVQELAESEFTVEYIAKNAPGIDEEKYRDVGELINYSEIAHLDQESIEWLLHVDMTHRDIWNDVELWNRLLSKNESWMDYFANLTTFGDPIYRLENETIVQLALYALDEFQQDPYQVFTDINKINELFKEDNELSKELLNQYDVTTDHDGWVQARANERNTSFSASGYSTDRWDSSNYSNERAVKLLEESEKLRKIITQGRVGVGGEDFEYSDLFDGTELNNFWEEDFDYEFIKDARATSNTSTGRRTVTANSNIEISDTIHLAANADTNANANNDQTAAADESAYIEAWDFDVENKNTLSVSFEGEIEENHESTNYNTWNGERTVNTTTTSEFTIDIGNKDRVVTEENHNGFEELNIEDENKIKLKLGVESDSSSRVSDYWGWELEASSEVSIDITDVTIE